MPDARDDDYVGQLRARVIANVVADARDDDYVAHFQARALSDALTNVHGQQLRERADRFEAAKHRPGIDFPGIASTEDLREQWRRCDERARALRSAAEVAVMS